jgi:hypothetical protein
MARTLWKDRILAKYIIHAQGYVRYNNNPTYLEEYLDRKVELIIFLDQKNGSKIYKARSFHRTSIRAVLKDFSEKHSSGYWKYPVYKSGKLTDYWIEGMIKQLSPCQLAKKDLDWQSMWEKVDITRVEHRLRLHKAKLLLREKT